MYAYFESSCFNDLFIDLILCCSFEDVACLGDSASISELSLDGNPLCQDPHYKQNVLRHMQQLRNLDMKRINVSYFN